MTLRPWPSLIVLVSLVLSGLMQRCELYEHREQIKDLQRRCGAMGQ